MNILISIHLSVYIPSSIEQTSFAIESVKDTQTTIFAMKAATGQLKAETKKMNFNEVEDMQDDLTGE
jgi:charged multivesicular body protein 5